MLEVLRQYARDNAWASTEIHAEISRTTMEGEDCLVQRWRVGWSKDAIGDGVEGALSIIVSARRQSKMKHFKGLRKSGHCV